MKRTFITLSFFLSVLCGIAQQTIELKDWKFATSDNTEWGHSRFDDLSWKAIAVGKNWKQQGYPDYDG